MKACKDGNQKSFIPRVHWPYSLLSSTDVNEGDCQSWQIQGVKQAQRQGTDFISKHLHFTPPFCLPPLLIALKQQGWLQVKLSLKWDHYQLFCLAEEESSTSSLQCRLPHGGRWTRSTAEPSAHAHTEAQVLPVWQCIYSNLPESTLASAKTQQVFGSSLKVGPCSFGHVDTLGEIFTSATDGWKQH